MPAAHRTAQFESFTWGPGGFQRHGGGPAAARGGFGGGGFDDILKEMFGGAAAARARRARPAHEFEPDDFGGGAAGQDVSGTVTITLEEVATGTTRRVHLPTGKEVEAKIPAGSRRRPDHPAEGAGAARARAARRATR